MNDELSVVNLQHTNVLNVMFCLYDGDAVIAKC